MSVWPPFSNLTELFCYFFLLVLVLPFMNHDFGMISLDVVNLHVTQTPKMIYVYVLLISLAEAPISSFLNNQK